MSASLDNGVDDDTTGKKRKSAEPKKKNNVVRLCPSAVERQLRRNPNAYADLMRGFLKATQET